MSLCSFPILLPSSVSDGAGQKFGSFPLNCPRGSFSVSPFPFVFSFSIVQVSDGAGQKLFWLCYKLSAWQFFRFPFSPFLFIQSSSCPMVRDRNCFVAHKIIRMAVFLSICFSAVLLVICCRAKRFSKKIVCEAVPIQIAVKCLLLSVTYSRLFTCRPNTILSYEKRVVGA